MELHDQHTVGTVHQKVEPTCTQTGNLAYYDCVECGFSCIYEYYVPQEQLIIPALGHEEVPYMNFQMPTCTHAGRDIGLMCDRCGEILFEGAEIPALPHTEEVVKGKPATATEKGLTDGLRCSVCGEILQAQQEIPALGTNGSQSRKPNSVALVFIGLSVALALSAVVTTVIIVIKKKKG